MCNVKIRITDNLNPRNMYNKIEVSGFFFEDQVVCMIPKLNSFILFK